MPIINKLCILNADYCLLQAAKKVSSFTTNLLIAPQNF